MNYIGSKYSLIENILSLITEHVPIQGSALDLFSGTSTVAQALKSLGFRTYANDWQYYSFVTAHSYLHFNEYPRFEKLLKHAEILSLYQEQFPEGSHQITIHSLQKRGRSSEPQNAFTILWFLEQLPGTTGSFFHQYAEGGDLGRLYFSKDNGQKIQAIGDQISNWEQSELLSEAELHWLRASLVESADRIANTASVYGAFLKKIKKSAKKPLRMIALAPVSSPKSDSGHKAFCADAGNLFREKKLPRMSITYIDPPYNQRQYSGNYHILETIARWDLDTFEPRGKTGLRNSSDQSSPFCSKRKALDAFDRLFASIDSDYLLFSYNNEGLISEPDLKQLFEKHCSETQFFKLNYGRFRADNDGTNRKYAADSVVEFLVLGRKK